MLVMDSLWLSLFMTHRYKKMVRRVQRGEDMNPRLFPAAFIAYGVMALGFYLFCLEQPASQDVGIVVRDSWRSAAFGFVMYSLYNSTAFAVFDRWSLFTACFDVLWGTILFAVAYVVAFLTVPATL